MGTTNKTFSVKNGISVANTIIIDSSANLSNIAQINASSTLNVGGLDVLATVNSSLSLAANAYTLAVAGQTSVFVAGTLIANNPNVNFVSANTSNISIVGTSNTSPGNVTITIDTRLPPGGGGGSPGGANQQIQFNNSSAFGGQSNLLYNVASNTMSVEGNVRLSNASNLYFGGSQGNTVANAHFYMTWNASTTSLDFVYNGN